MIRPWRHRLDFEALSQDSARCLKHSFSYGFRQIDSQEIVIGIEVILARFIDDTNLVMLGRHSDRERPGRASAIPETRRNHGSSRIRQSVVQSGSCLPIQNSLNLVFLAAEPMSLIPVNFSPADRAIAKPNPRNALTLSPTPGSVGLLQTPQLPNAPAGCDCLNPGDVADDCEMHEAKANL